MALLFGGVIPASELLVRVWKTLKYRHRPSWKAELGLQGCSQTPKLPCRGAAHPPLLPLVRS